MSTNPELAAMRFKGKLDAAIDLGPRDAHSPNICPPSTPQIHQNFPGKRNSSFLLEKYKYQDSVILHIPITYCEGPRTLEGA